VIGEKWNDDQSGKIKNLIYTSAPVSINPSGILHETK
jgi:hypothetical protein